MKITMYELLGLVKDKVDIDTYIRYYDKLDNKIDVMLACKENIIYNLDRTSIELNDEVEILEEKKIPENLPFKNDMKLTIMEVYHELEKYNYKINEIIDYLKSKGK